MTPPRESRRRAGYGAGTPSVRYKCFNSFRVSRLAFDPGSGPHHEIDGPPISSQDRPIPIRKQTTTRIAIVFTAPESPGWAITSTPSISWITNVTASPSRNSPSPRSPQPPDLLSGDQREQQPDQRSGHACAGREEVTNARWNHLVSLAAATGGRNGPGAAKRKRARRSCSLI